MSFEPAIDERKVRLESSDQGYTPVRYTINTEPGDEDTPRPICASNGETQLSTYLWDSVIRPVIVSDKTNA